MPTEGRSMVVFGGTVEARGTSAGALIRSPLTKTSLNAVVQVEVPVFLTLQVLVNAVLGLKAVPSGTVLSAVNVARSAPECGGGVFVGVGGVPVTVGIGVKVAPPARVMRGPAHRARSPLG